ncbi:MAG TPA: HAMP domain-containing sensor histidine kinase [Candidatus Dormibacteraeota bacterium]|nr:HAMP domain-containing sensor histidine kinase [Candidatus Dormibacteraeota bacterium]
MWVHARGWPRPWARRLGCLFGLLGVLALVGLGAVVWSGLALAGQGAPRGPHPLAYLGIGIAVVAIVMFASRFRRLTEPLDGLVEAARRVERGDYTARVGEPAAGDAEMRQLVRAFNTMAARLETDEAQRRRLMADVSHELRTPLAVIRGDLEAMVDGVHPADEAHLSLVLDEAGLLERLVEDLRTLSLADAGALTLHREPTDVDVLLGETVASLRSTAERGGVALHVAAPPDLPLADVDPVRIREVLGNLVSNALRHTPSGGSVAVEASAEGGWLRIVVRDSGEGIPPDLLPHVFERFARGPSSRGSGLGLAIARDLVVAHGGTIEVESRQGRGTAFTFRLPVDDDDSGPPRGRSTR